MNDSIFKRGMALLLRCVILAAGMVPMHGNAQIYKLELANISNGYGSCVWENNGNGTSTISLTINYKKAEGNTGGRQFSSRGILVYTYDSNGVMQSSSLAARTVWINGVPHDNTYKGNGYAIYSRITKNWDDPTGWHNKYSYTANVSVLIDNSAIKDWPAIAIRAGNFTPGNDVGEIRGAAYLSGLGSKACEVIDPTTPPPEPPPAISVAVAAPDWDLGELSRGAGVEKTLARPADQLCFTYSGVAGTKNFVIDAQSRNGIADGTAAKRYLLRNGADTSRTIPYDLTLNSGTASFTVPNAAKRPIALNKDNRTCFTPTFRTWIDSTVKTGDYSDVLTFMIFTKS
ncbi:hypothetical protein L2Y90_23885 [Burkholderia pyrrocinia]|uniref:hypothetical protein n=1 Tax=Burkholderia pyrrocinia TaxID=60550 RepID=UPI00215B2B2D|nr:hypothetical protein [Burkholderia pyrrocinia]UVE69759.1 hypothetical protein L2Y90_23885 [Burkholderia pyrrocinia]